MTNRNICPCNSGRLYSSCCEPLIDGNKSATTAEAMMRSRYTANVVKDVEYLLKTWHSSTKPKYMLSATIPELYGLQIVRTKEGSEADDRGVVEFKAKSILQNKIWNLHEISHFVKEKDQWLYVDGDLLESPPAITNKIGRNEPCPCGSGKKFKKCCGP